MLVLFWFDVPDRRGSGVVHASQPSAKQLAVDPIPIER